MLIFCGSTNISDLNLFFRLASQPSLRSLKCNFPKNFETLKIDHEKLESSLTFLESIEPLKIEILYLTELPNRYTPNSFISSFFQKLPDLTELILCKYKNFSNLNFLPQLPKLRKITFMDLPSRVPPSILFDKLVEYPQLLSIQFQCFQYMRDEIKQLFIKKKFKPHTELLFIDEVF